MDSSPSSSPPAFQFLEAGFDDDTKPHCTVCGKVFKRMYALERHLLIHDPERARFENKCPYEGCKFSSLQKSNVKTHIAAVHEKVKHTCTLPCTSEDALDAGPSYSERCGRIFSDVPALIRHEKRAHGFYRRGFSGRARAKSFKILSRSSAAVAGSPPREPISDPESRETSKSSPSDEKVQFWLDGGDSRTTVSMDYGSEDMTPSAATFAHDESYNSKLNYASTSVSTPAITPTSISDAESMTNSSTSSFISTSPSPAPPEQTPTNQYYPTVLTYPPSYPQPQNYYCPYPSVAYGTNQEYSLHPAQFAQPQPQSTVFYDTEHLNPRMEEWHPQLAEMKLAMQAGAILDGDGIVPALSLFD